MNKGNISPKKKQKKLALRCELDLTLKKKKQTHNVYHLSSSVSDSKQGIPRLCNHASHNNVVMPAPGNIVI